MHLTDFSKSDYISCRLFTVDPPEDWMNARRKAAAGRCIHSYV
jgi:hypothetical protein